MFWADKLISNFLQSSLYRNNNDKTFIVNDSKTPSGRVHVGALRGVVIHYIINKLLNEHGKSEFLYGCDDFDAVDDLSANMKDKWGEYMGVPLCNAPSPDPKIGKNFADYYMSEFKEVINSLGIYPTFYNTSEIYKSGKFNESIDIILNNHNSVVDIYKRVSSSDKPINWYPYQVICEKCGKISTTSVKNYINQQVEYKCEKNLVSWANGCGYEGKISPFNGNGKLPWKLEWIAKWNVLNVDIEAAGKDHSSKGGARDVSNMLFKEIFQKEPPYNLAYEFLLINKQKMSSSKGLGSTSKEISNIIPPELLKFLMIRYTPNSVIDFSPYGETIPNLYNEYDKCNEQFYKKIKEDGNINNKGDILSRPFKLSHVNKKVINIPNIEFLKFSTIAVWMQVPSINLKEKIESEFNIQLTQNDIIELQKRERFAKLWLDKFADIKYKFNFITEPYNDKLDAKILLFDDHIIDILNKVSNKVKESIQDKNFDFSKEIKHLIYTICKQYKLKMNIAFKVMYNILIDKDSGPKIENIISITTANSFTKRLDFVIERYKLIKS